MTYSVEEFTDAVVSYLGQMLPTALDDIYAKYAAADAAAGRSIDYVTPLIGEAPDGDYYPGGADVILRYPAIEVALPDAQVSGFDIAQQVADADLVLILVAHDSHARFPVLYRRVLRLTAAVWECVHERGALPGSAVISSARIAWRFNPETGERDEIQSGGLISLRVGSTSVAP